MLACQASTVSCSPSVQLQSHPLACCREALTEQRRADEMKDAAYPPPLEQGNWGRKHHRWAGFSRVSVQSTSPDLLKSHRTIVATPAFQATALSITEENNFHHSPPKFFERFICFKMIKAEIQAPKAVTGMFCVCQGW